MGHHFYFYHDDAVEQFETICWNDKTTRNHRCSDGDFVSDYARTLAEEDYAEHFMYWFLERPVPLTPIIQQKFEHFNEQQRRRR
jgi:hypothetical protein